MLRLSVHQYEKQVPGPRELRVNTLIAIAPCYEMMDVSSVIFNLCGQNTSLSHGNYYTKPSNPLDRKLGFCKLLAA